MLEHLGQSLFRNVTGRFPVDFVAELHVIRRNRFRDGAGSASCLKKLPGDLLSGTDLRKGAVFCFIQVYGERFTICREKF